MEQFGRKFSDPFLRRAFPLLEYSFIFLFDADGRKTIMEMLKGMQTDGFDRTMATKGKGVIKVAPFLLEEPCPAEKSSVTSVLWMGRTLQSLNERRG
jgi:hypothetical protein